VKLPAQVLIDASVAIKWVIKEPGSDEAVLLLDRQLTAPDLLCAECANILWKKVARRELSRDEAEVAARALEAVEIDFIAMRSFLAAATALAIQLGHPAYDCVYLAVAITLEVPFVTADQRFVQKVRQVNRRLRERVVALVEVPEAL
jgi:predicted nucleic acid-binding protein